MSISRTHEDVLADFHSQIEHILNGYQSPTLDASKYHNLVIGGLGGSGIGGRIARLVFLNSSPIPVEVYSEYALPAYASNKTLVILSSYSGNTEETLAMYADAKKRGCDIIVLSSGGKITDMAQADGFPVYGSPLGYQPRQALGFSLSTLLLILGDLFGSSMRSSLDAVVAMLKGHDGLKAAQELAAYFGDTLTQKFVVVCDLPYEAAAIRFCQQVQENAKTESFVSVLPESNHNMMESYYSHHDTNFIFLNSGSNSRVNLRFAHLETVLRNLGNKMYVMNEGNGNFDLNALFASIHTMDWLSILVSNANNADNMTVPNIMELKAYLDNH